MKTVAVLGAGLVSAPMVRYLAASARARVVVADQSIERARAVAAGHPGASARALDAKNDEALAAIVRDADLVVSLLPYTMHVAVARQALRFRRDLVTTSYVSPAMAALDAEARDAGVLLLNEIGLDPGIDHMSAMALLDRLRSEGATITGFHSVCGGLPAPECDDNPWRYKFSWSPRGVLLAGLNPARFIRDGVTIEVPAGGIFDRAEPYAIPDAGAFEVYPNRDSVPYAGLYGIEGVRTMFRGTLRWPGWCATLKAAASLGLLDATVAAWPPSPTCAEVLESLVGPGPGTVRERAATRLGLPPGDPVLERLAWAGLFSTEPVGGGIHSPLDLLNARLEERMTYRTGERDMIVLEHRIDAAGAGGGPVRSVSTLVAFGEPGGDSAMARTVSLPAAIAARLRLEGRLPLVGVHVPVTRAIWEPVLRELGIMGIAFTERTL